MKILYNNSREYSDCTDQYYSFEDLENGNNNLLYSYGIYMGYCTNDLPINYKNKIYADAEEPNGFTNGQLPHERENGLKLDYWTKIFQFCPYTAEWLNNIIYKTDKFLFTTWPSPHIKYFPNPNQLKIYDVFYQGSIHGWKQSFSGCIDTITKYKYAWTSISDYPDKRKTKINIPFRDKLLIGAQSKMTIVENLLHDPQIGMFSKNIKKIHGWNLNEAFSHIDQGIMPQFKAKILESMMSKTLSLVQKSPWDIMEKFGFIEGVHFFILMINMI